MEKAKKEKLLEIIRDMSDRDRDLFFGGVAMGEMLASAAKQPEPAAT